MKLIIADTEIPVVFPCQGQSLVGILHKPGSAAAHTQRGVLIVVGGPQYRVGSHRQFVLLARSLCKHGIPVLRFDYRGMGDGEGNLQSFEDLNQDIKAALEEFNSHYPNLNEFVIWGLCDAASAALFYAHTDERVNALVLLNPWVRTEAGRAKTYLKNYYLDRLSSKEFWSKLIGGKFNFVTSIKSLLGLVAQSKKTMPPSQSAQPATEQDDALTGSLPDNMAACFERYQGRVLFILSGNNDYVADEFRDVVKASKEWQQLLARPTTEVKNFDEANHTFSRSDWRTQVENWTYQWVIEE